LRTTYSSPSLRRPVLLLIWWTALCVYVVRVNIMLPCTSNLLVNLISVQWTNSGGAHRVCLSVYLFMPWIIVCYVFTIYDENGHDCKNTSECFLLLRRLIVELRNGLSTVTTYANGFRLHDALNRWFSITCIPWMNYIHGGDAAILFSAEESAWYFPTIKGSLRMVTWF
jgi:hypothetical protein